MDPTNTENSQIEKTHLLEKINDRLQILFGDRILPIKAELESKRGIIVGSFINDGESAIDNLEMVVILPRHTSGELEIVEYLHKLCHGTGRINSSFANMYLYENHNPSIKIIILNYMGTYKQFIPGESKYLYRYLNGSDDLQLITYGKN